MDLNHRSLAYEASEDSGLLYPAVSPSRFELETSAFAGRCSIQLSYGDVSASGGIRTHNAGFRRSGTYPVGRQKHVFPSRFELETFSFGGRCSIQLSYGNMWSSLRPVKPGFQGGFPYGCGHRN